MEEHKTEEVTPLSQKCIEIAEQMVTTEEIDDDEGHEFLVVLKAHNSEEVLLADPGANDMEHAERCRKTLVEKFAKELEEIVKEINET